MDDAEKILKDFKPVTYDVSTHVKAIETFETKAVSSSSSLFLDEDTGRFSYDDMCACFFSGLGLVDRESEGDDGENRC